VLPNDGEGAAELITGPPRADRTADEVDLRAGHATLGGGVEAGTAATFPGSWARDSRRRHLPVALLVVAYVVWFSYLSLKLYNGYGDPPFDLAIFDQGLWLITHFHTPFVTVMGRNLFGDHTSFILLLIAPLYRLFPEPQGILIIQTVALGAAAVPIYLVATKLVKSTTAATLVVAAYLLNPALQQGNLEQFHPEALQVLIISVAIYAAIESRLVLACVMVALALLVKEDAAVLVVPLGLWVAWRRNRKVGLGIVGAGVLWAYVANEFIIPGFLGSNTFYTGRIPFGGLGGLLRTTFERPAQFFSYIWSGGRPFYVWQMSASFGWAFLLAPEVAAIAFLVLLENVMSNDPYMHQILYHYSMPLVPVLAMGTVFALGAVKNVQRRTLVAVFVAASAFCSCALWGLAPFSRNAIEPGWSPNSALGRAVTYVEQALPANAVVSAWYPYVAHVDHRTQVYVWPTPFSAANWGLGTDTGARLPVASQVQYLMLPYPLDSSENPDVFGSISVEYRVVRSRDGVALYEKLPTLGSSTPGGSSS
jgi:uncharacterized membrane protein